MKKFWKKAEGFTLVELVVVIAILGILAGVGTVGYSGYVKKANMAADQQLASDVEQALMLAYYGRLNIAGGSVTLGTSGATATTEEIAAAMEAVFGANWQDTCKLKYNGWTNTQKEIKDALTNSSFSDGNGGLNMELLGAVDNLTGQLSGVMGGGALKLQNFPGYTAFLADNGIDPGNTQLAANAAVLYLSQSSMEPGNRDYVRNLLKNPDTWGYGSTYDLENSFIKKVALEGKCTEFEALAMAYATMQGYCMQKDKELKENGEDPHWAVDLAGIDLTTKSDGTTPVDDEIAVLKKLCEEFTAMVDADLNGDRSAFQDYLYGDYGSAEQDIKAYYGVIDGISENKDTFMKKLNDDADFYASHQGLLESYWNLDLDSGDVAVSISVKDGAPETLVTGMSE